MRLAGDIRFSLLSLGLLYLKFRYLHQVLLVFFPTGTTRGSWVENGLFFIPMAIMIVIGSIAIGDIIYRSIRAWISVKELDRQKHWSYVKISFFGLGFLLIFLIVFIARFTLVDNTGSVTASFESWVDCCVDEYIEGLTSNDCGSHPVVRVNQQVFLLQYVALSMHGVLLFLLFFMDRELWLGWRMLGMDIHQRAIYIIYGKSRMNTLGSRSTIDLATGEL